jgi:hypothetical protein
MYMSLGSTPNLGSGGESFVEPWKFFLYGFGVMIALVVVFVVVALTKSKVI